MVKASFGLNDQANIGSIFYTSMQAVPAFLPSIIKKKNIPCLIPLISRNLQPIICLILTYTRVEKDSTGSTYY